MVDTRCFIFLPEKFDELSDFLDKIDERRGYFVEHAIFDSVIANGARPGLFLGRPILSGLSGSTNVVVRMHWGKRIVIRLANFFSR